jgi:isoquinoline 1-oxidoreductase beta subunit
MKRRTFALLAAVVSGGYLVGIERSTRPRQTLRRSVLTLNHGQIALNGWVKLGTDGTATAVMAKSEMGQGIHTALMMLVAEELDCAWNQMRFENSMVDPLYGNVVGLAEGLPIRPDNDGATASSLRWVMTALMRQLGFMMTGGSSSVRDLWLPMREAAAVTRATLLEAVARYWLVPIEALNTHEGVITGADGRTMRYGDAVALLESDPTPASHYALKQPAQFKVIGCAMPRIDTGVKIDGSAKFGIDVIRPRQLYAAVRMSPARGGSVATFDANPAITSPGVIDVVKFDPTHGGSGGIAVVAAHYWQARSALASMKPEFDAGPMATTSSAAIIESLSVKLETDDGFTFWKTGDVDHSLKLAGRTLRAEYRAPYLAHATLEPMNCTVEYRGDRATVWAATQVPSFARKAAAKILDLPEDRVDIQVTYLGGGFGRRLEVDFVAQAAAIAKKFPRRPVQVIWDREQDTRHDFYRPACVARFAAALTDTGHIAAWRNVSAGQAIVPGYLARNAGMPSLGPDKTTAEGAFDQAYEFPIARVGHVTVDLPVPVGFWRSVGHSHQAFFQESFLDECAHAAKADPLQYRLAHLAQHPRHRAVLELAASKAGWNAPLDKSADGAQKARGIALHESFGSIVAQVAEVSLAKNRGIRVHRLVCAIDCGLAINPSLIAQQMEGAVIFGLTAALYGRIDIDQGAIQQGNFHEYPLIRLNECPAVETHIVPTGAAPQGVGEPGVPPIAPAVANAIFQLTAQRLRTLPLTLNPAPQS